LGLLDIVDAEASGRFGRGLSKRRCDQDSKKNNDGHEQAHDDLSQKIADRTGDSKPSQFRRSIAE